MPPMIRQLLFSAFVAASLLATGCASVVNGHVQSVSVTTRNQSEPVTGAQCSLLNDKGMWYVTTPGSVSVQRSFGALTVACTMAGQPPGTATATSATTAAVFGNVLVGGVIGAGIDVATGAAYDCPNVIAVEMGRSTIVSPPPSSASARTSTTADPALLATSVPYLNEAQQAQYRTFLTRPLPRAFAIATNGHYASTYTTGPFDKSLPTDPKERALLVCSRLAGVPCELFAVDNQIVFQRPQPATTKVRSSPGTFPADPALAAAHVPYLNDGQRAEYQVFLTQPPPRAFAISENGHYATAWSNTPSDKSMPSDPRERALAYCRLFSGQECRLFLVNNEIVYRRQ